MRQTTTTIVTADEIKGQSEDILALIRSKGFDLLPKSLQKRIWKEFEKLNGQYIDLTASA